MKYGRECRIQTKILTTLPLAFQVFYEKKIENLNYTVGKDINFVFFGKFVTALAQKRRKNVNKLI